MLKEYYADFSNSIINYEGEIYQYVGDEIIVSWKLKNGIRNNNCFKCFFDLKQALLGQTEKYGTKYGIVPVFKAGFHIGKVTTGEIGEIKKIFFLPVTYLIQQLAYKAYVTPIMLMCSYPVNSYL